MRHGKRTLAVRDAVIRHDFGKSRTLHFFGWKIRVAIHAPWKVYYGARNQLYTLTRPQIEWRAVLFYFLSQARMFLRNLIAQPFYAPLSTWMQLRGFVHGLRGKLGIVVLPS